MRHLKPLLILCLCLTMLATSVTNAFARGQMAFGQTLQICNEGEVSDIILDAHGNKLNPTHLCPECLAVTAGLPPAAFELPQALAQWQRITLPMRALLATQDHAHARARGPPALI